MEEVRCPVCGSEKRIPLWSKQGAHYDRCAQCTLVYENPRLSAAELKEFYSDPSYFIRADPTSPVSGYENYDEQCTPALREEYFDLVEKYAGKGPGRVLDVGCGPGGLLEVARDRGWEATGLEISDWAVQRGRSAGLDIRNTLLQEAAFRADSFDAITMFDVLEHLPEPVQTLEEVCRILKPGAVLLVETPNIGGFFARFLYREKSELIKPRAHICLYTPESIRRLFGQISFSKTEIRTFPYSRKFSFGYLKGVLASRVKPGVIPLQLTWNESFRIVSWK